MIYVLMCGSIFSLHSNYQKLSPQSERVER